MLLTRNLRVTSFALIALAFLVNFPMAARAQAALLTEEPYGFFGTLNPTGHNAIYFARICAETPTRLRRCAPGESGSVISRYQGIAGYDWVAMPLLPYLYSVENASDVPERADHATVLRLRNRYRESHLADLGDNVPPGSMIRGGWTQLVGVSYDRRTYVFRFETTEEQDDALIALLNDRTNRSHFNLLFNNCSDFARRTLDFYFPGAFRRRRYLRSSGRRYPVHCLHHRGHPGQRHDARAQLHRPEGRTPARSELSRPADARRIESGYYPR